MPRLPNFIVIGAARSGTNALYEYLRQHPAVYVASPKEPRFFAFEDAPPAFGGPKPNDYTALPTWTRLADYTALFEPSADQTAVGEASTVYLYYPGDKPAERIRFHVPHAKLVAILRQPADRAYSNFLLAVQSGWEPLHDFAEALAAEPARTRANWSYFLRYRQNSAYYEQLLRFYRRFPRSQIKVFLYEDLTTRPLAMLEETFRFLEVNPTFRPDVSARRVASRGHRSRAIDEWLRSPPARSAALAALLPAGLRRTARAAIRRWNVVRPPPLDPALRRELTDAFRPDVLRLQELIGRDLSDWLA